MTEVEGAENQVASSRGSPGCEGFRSVFACFNYPVLKFWPIGLSAVTFPWQPSVLTGQEWGHPKLTPCPGPTFLWTPGARLGCPLSLFWLPLPSPSSCVPPGLVTLLVPAVTPRGAVPSDQKPLAWDVPGAGQPPWVTLGRMPEQPGDVTAAEPSSDPPPVHPWGNGGWIQGWGGNCTSICEASV